ncbi:MAG: hypothetical protein CMI98_04805 [Pelagibacteraceae bacterium]|nr:hypothetical protein [Pelagibacteraceae bacterium]
MFYGDLHLIDILIFAGIAAFLFYRLSGVLGKKTGFEKSPAEPPIDMIEPIQKNETKNKVVDLDPKYEKLKTAYEYVNNFDHIEFLEGAKRAFEMIVTSFNEGDKEKLKPLLTSEIFSIFAGIIDAKKNNNNLQILSIEILSIDNVETLNKKILISLTYSSSQIDNKTDKQITKKDTWTFEKLKNSNAPNWVLAST